MAGGSGWRRWLKRPPQEKDIKSTETSGARACRCARKGSGGWLAGWLAGWRRCCRRGNSLDQGTNESAVESPLMAIFMFCRLGFCSVRDIFVILTDRHYLVSFLSLRKLLRFSILSWRGDVVDCFCSHPPSWICFTKFQR